MPHILDVGGLTVHVSYRGIIECSGGVQSLSQRRENRRLRAIAIALVYVPMLGLTACTGSAVSRNHLAAQGLIEENAPVKATAEIVIAAPAHKIMGLLTDINGWPKWQPDISKATVHGNPAVGTEFVWSTGGMEVHSTLQLIDPDRSLCWTGRVLYFHAIHCWMLSELPDGKVLVKTRESMDGWLIARIYASPKLLQSDQRWLNQLKQAAEEFH